MARSRAARRRRRRTALVVLAVAAVVPGYLLVTAAEVLVAAWRADPDGRAGSPAVVLGAAQYDGTPSPALRARLERALELHHDGTAPVVVVTGAGREGDRLTEAAAAADWLRARGVADEALRLEVTGRNSWEQVRAAARVLHDEGATSATLVSDPWHVRRLRGIAAEVGLDADVAATGRADPRTVTPQRLARETAGVALGRLVGYRRLAHLGWRLDELALAHPARTAEVRPPRSSDPPG